MFKYVCVYRPVHVHVCKYICICMFAYKYLCMCAFLCVWACMCAWECSECGLSNVMCAECCILTPYMAREQIKPLGSWKPQIYKTVHKMIAAVKNISWSEMEKRENWRVYWLWDPGSYCRCGGRKDLIQVLKAEQKPEKKTDHKSCKHWNSVAPGQWISKCKGPGEERCWLFWREKRRPVWLEPTKEGQMAMDKVRK